MRECLARKLPPRGLKVRTASSKARHLLLEQIPERFRVDLGSTLLSLGSMRLPIGAYALNAAYANDNQFD